ncbi:MAG: ferredoxin family protein [Anaerobutyricum sp.]
MSVRILQNKCVGCGRCLSVCPGNLLKKVRDGKVHIRNIRDCWGCTACLKECHTGSDFIFSWCRHGRHGIHAFCKRKR